MNAFIRIDSSDGVAVVTMDAPPLNVQTTEFCAQLLGAFDELDEDRSVRAVVLTGAGKAFSAGADIHEYVDPGCQPGARARQFRLRREAYFSIVGCSKPVIAAINGPALGAGLGLAVCCDILMASDTAVVALPEINVGFIGGARHVMRAFPYSLVRRLVLTGEPVSSQELYRRGLIEECVESENLMARALEMAGRLASKSATVVAHAKRAINIVEQLEFKEGFRHEQEVTAELMKHPESVEATRAFIEKREPSFQQYQGDTQ